MSRSGYDDNIDDEWQLIRWRGAVASAIRGKRGQAFLKEMLAALDALPEPKLLKKELEADGAVCAIGAVGRARGVDMSKIDPEVPAQVCNAFDIPDALAREIMFENDEGVAYWHAETPEDRFTRMRAWIERLVRREPAKGVA